jgi:hypothetical protein
MMMKNSEVVMNITSGAFKIALRGCKQKRKKKNTAKTADDDLTFTSSRSSLRGARNTDKTLSKFSFTK